MNEKDFKEECIEKIENINGDKDMSYIKNGRRYYKTKVEALLARRAGDKIYYDAYERAYYIVRPKRRKSFWGW